MEKQRPPEAERVLKATATGTREFFENLRTDEDHLY
jgi:hypothetical protein